MNDGRNFPKTTKLYCSGLELSEQQIAALLEAEPVDSARKLIQIFDETPGDEGKTRVLHLLFDIGDEEITRNFCAELLQHAEFSPLLKSFVTRRCHLYKYRKLARELASKVPSGERAKTTDKPAKILAFRRPTDK